MRLIYTLKPIPPYNFQLMLDVLSRYSHPITDVHYQGAYWRVLEHAQTLHLICVQSSGTVDNPTLAVYLAKTDKDHTQQAIEQLIKQIEHILNTTIDLSQFYSYAQTEPLLWGVVKPLLGLHWLRTPTVFEALMLTIISSPQRNNFGRWAARRQPLQCLIFPVRVAISLSVLHQFPSLLYFAMSPLRSTDH